MNTLEDYREELERRYFVAPEKELESIKREIRVVKLILELEAKGMKFDEYV